MKFVCPACQTLAEIAAVRAEGARVVFTCGLCGAETVQEGTPGPAPAPPGARASGGGQALAAAPRPLTLAGVPRPAVVLALRKAPLSPEAAHDPFFIPRDRCPKCLATRGETAHACSRCGLVYAHADQVNFDPPPGLGELWQGLWENWENPVEHERFRQAALAQGELAQAGRLYQLRLARAPGDTLAERGRNEVLRLVATVASLERTPVRDTRRVRQVGWAMLMLFMTALAALLARFLLLRP